MAELVLCSSSISVQVAELKQNQTLCLNRGKNAYTAGFMNLDILKVVEKHKHIAPFLSCTVDKQEGRPSNEFSFNSLHLWCCIQAAGYRHFSECFENDIL